MAQTELSAFHTVAPVAVEPSRNNGLYGNGDRLLPTTVTLSAPVHAPLLGITELSETPSTVNVWVKLRHGDAAVPTTRCNVPTPTADLTPSAESETQRVDVVPVPPMRIDIDNDH